MPDLGRLDRSTPWSGVRAVVVGIGVSGFAAADNLLHVGASVTVVAEYATPDQLASGARVLAATLHEIANR